VSRSVFVVFVATVDTQTGGLKSRNIVGIYGDAVEARKLEQRFNEEEQKATGVVVKAFVTRYSLPYVAPAVKPLME